MSVRLKIIFTVLPLVAVPLLLTGFASSFSAETGISKIAIEFLGFKAEELKKYGDSQWELLVSNGLDTNPEFVDVAQKSMESYAGTLVRTELIFAINALGETTAATREIVWAEGERAAVKALRDADASGWISFRLEGKERVAQAFYFEPFDWFVAVTEERDTFYREVREILLQNIIILAASAFFSILLLLSFSGYITRPISRMSTAMEGIIKTNNLKARVEVEYHDEIGKLARTFNIMIQELDNAYSQIKNFALKSVLAQQSEKKIRNIFQKYVPANVIDEIFTNPESMLVGQNRELAILFSDIRSFTTISETMVPDELVKSLNRYFSVMVDVITKRRGIVDKYIGDAIMAFFGAPIRSENDALLAVWSALEMIEALEVFNSEQRKLGTPEFRIGVGINYGEVTVGNIGSEKKMDYTVIGDMVNLASRLEGLTKKYHQSLVFSESVYQNIGQYLYCRMLDKVVVKGKTTGESIYTAKRVLSDVEKKGWATYHSGLDLYYQKNFRGAKELFGQVFRWLPGDEMAQEFIGRCDHWITTPLPVDWNGMEIMHDK